MDGSWYGKMIGGLMDGLGTLIIMAYAFIIIAIGVAGYGIYKFWHRNDPQIFKVQEQVAPTIELTTDGATVDTLYVYTFK